MDLNDWESRVVEAELARPGFVAWYRNPGNATPASLRIAYRNDADEWASLQPDFVIVSRRDDGSLAASIVDPHGDHPGDARAKLHRTDVRSQSYNRLHGDAPMSFPLPDGMSDAERTDDGWQTRISLPTDADGFFGRLCPDVGCRAYFKLNIHEYHTAREAGRLTCPVCGTTADDEDFHSAEQRERIEAGLREFAQGVIDEAIRDVFGRSPSVRRRSPGVTFTYRPPPRRFPTPLPTYVERATVRAFSCSGCGHRTVAYDLVSFCPYCGDDTPPRPILDENLAAMGRLLDLIEQMPDDARKDVEAIGGATAQVERALVGACAALQHFAQQLHSRAGKQLGRDRNPWQNLLRLAKEWRRSFSADPLDTLSRDDQSVLRLGFARRHVLEHNGGRIDQRYLDESEESGVVGRRLRIRAPFVRDFFAATEELADKLER